MHDKATFSHYYCQKDINLYRDLTILIIIFHRSGSLSLLVNFYPKNMVSTANILRRSGPCSLLVNSNCETTISASNIFRRSGPLLLRRAVRPGFSVLLNKGHLRAGHVDGLAPSSTLLAPGSQSLLREP
jgi:hypothetical protein